MNRDLYTKMYYLSLTIQAQVEAYKIGFASELDHKHLIQTALMDLYNLVDSIKEGE